MIRSSLRTPSFRMLWLGQTISIFGDRIFLIALAITLVQSGRVVDLGLTLATVAVTTVIASPMAGVLGDRVPRRRLMLVADCLRLIAVGALAVSPALVPRWLLLLSACGLGVGDGLFSPAYAAILPRLVPLEVLQGANALNSISARVAAFSGPPIAVGLLAIAGVRFAFAVDAGSFAFSAMTLLGVCESRGELNVPVGFGLKSLREGLREITSRPWFGAVMLVSTLHMAVGVAAWSVLLPSIALNWLGGQAAYSAILVIFGVGAFFAAVTAGMWRPRRRGLVAMLWTYPFAACLAALALRLPIWAVLPLAFAAGAGIEVLGIIWSTTVQTEIPDRALARVTSLDYAASGSLFPLGLALMGPAAATFGAPVVLGLAAIVVAATA